jgi:hypothetical protein
VSAWRARPAETAPGTTAARDRLARSGCGRPDPPEPGALRPLARALVDLALALEDEDEEEQPWMR